MISQSVEYALRAMVHLAGLEHDVSAPSEIIAARTKVPQDYLSKVLRDLTVAELIRSKRGPRGGYSLARPPAHISMLDVVNAVDPFPRITKCPLGNPAHIKLCPLHRRIDDSMNDIERQFKQTSLAEIIAETASPAKGCSALTTPTVRGAKR